ncbi:MAG: GNAT family N-acetyltransferase [Actinomycetota bacterium]|nr:GNAT family N-acetyltransferase [Actinomycetota bacterium]
MDIREALQADWPRIYPFYATTVEVGETYAFPLAQSQDEAESWWMEKPPGLTFVATDGDDVLGSAKAGPNRPGRGSHVATASFMVDPRHRGRGVGRALGEHVIAWARDGGYVAMQFNAVVETNTAAVALWKALGFEVIGTVPEAFEHRIHGPVGLHVMYRRL